MREDESIVFLYLKVLIGLLLFISTSPIGLLKEFSCSVGFLKRKSEGIGAKAVAILLQEYKTFEAFSRHLPLEQSLSYPSV